MSRKKPERQVKYLIVKVIIKREDITDRAFYEFHVAVVRDIIDAVNKVLKRYNINDGLLDHEELKDVEDIKEFEFELKRMREDPFYN